MKNLTGKGDGLFWLKKLPVIKNAFFMHSAVALHCRVTGLSFYAL